MASGWKPGGPTGGSRREGGRAGEPLRPDKMSTAGTADAIARAKAGDVEAWGEVYRMHAASIFRFCRRTLPAREDAEDATSEIFIKVKEKLGQYDASRPFPAWLYKVAANHCWDTLRRRRMRQDLESAEAEGLHLEHPDAGQLEQLISKRTSQQVRAALEKLPPRARMALTMRYYAEMEYEEIAEAMGLRKGFVGVVLLRARHQLREALERGSG